MGGKASAKDYQATEAEKTSAGVAKAEKDYFREKYDPLNRERRDQSFSEDNRRQLRSRANADTMQALTGDLTYDGTQRTDATGLAANALVGQLGIANQSAKDIQNKEQAAVLGLSRGQAADSQTGMGQASRLATSEALDRAKNNTFERNARLKMAGKLVRSGIRAKGAYDDKGMSDADREAGNFSNFTKLDALIG